MPATAKPRSVPSRITPDDLYNRAAAIEFLGSDSAYRAAVRNGLQYIKRGKRTFVKGSELIRFVTGENQH